MKKPCVRLNLFVSGNLIECDLSEAAQMWQDQLSWNNQLQAMGSDQNQK